MVNSFKALPMRAAESSGLKALIQPIGGADGTIQDAGDLRALRSRDDGLCCGSRAAARIRPIASLADGYRCQASKRRDIQEIDSKGDAGAAEGASRCPSGTGTPRSSGRSTERSTRNVGNR